MNQRRVVRFGCSVIAIALTGAACDGGGEPATTDVEVAREALSRGLEAPRLLAPLSTTHTPNQQPTFEWTQSDGAKVTRVEICADRSCDHVLQTFDVRGHRARPPAIVPDGPLFWRVTALVGGRRASPPSVAWEFWGTAMLFPQPGLLGPPADTTWGSVLDVNGDGFADLAVGAPGSSVGRVHIYFGGPAGPPNVPSQTLTGAASFGSTLASAGDVNGDGFADLAVGTAAGPGGVQLFYGGPHGLGSSSTTLRRGPVTAQFGATLSTAGDIDGDGYADLLVGGLEVAQVFLGGSDGVSRTASIGLAGDDATDPTAAPNATAATGGGDVNGDRIPDAVVNGRSYLGRRGSHGPGYRLEANRFQPGKYIGDMNGDGLTDYADGVVNPGSPQGLGTSPFRAIAGQLFFVGAGDANHDGFVEAIAAVSSITGLPEPWRVHYGNPLGCQSTDCGLPQNGLTLPGNQPPFSGWAPAGDLNGDHLEDLAVGVAADRAVYLFMADPTAGVPPTPTRKLTGPGEHFGAAVE